jgi:creatinine amidohydrolase
MRIASYTMNALRLALAALLVFAAARLVFAQTPDTVFLQELTWTELKDQIQAGKTTVIVPIGGTEQNGPAMALGKHNARAKALSERIAKALGNTLVAPVIAYVPEGGVNPPTAHMRLPGTITVPTNAFEKTLEYAARSFKLHGFRDVVLLGDHGGYQRNLKAVAARLNREWRKTPVRVHAIDEYYRAAASGYALLLRKHHYKESEIGTHAGLADTSLTLAVNPRLVRTGRLASGADLDAAHGVYGDPRRASAELGKLGIDLIVTRSVEAIKKAVAHH